MLKLISQKKALVKLAKLKADFRKMISEKYEFRAKSCVTCETPGACCLDAHFVNVRISPLEAEAILAELEPLPEPLRTQVFERVDHAIFQYDLSAEKDMSTQTYACPLFEKGTGCLVHLTAKPSPCINHACYENQQDLPPDELLDRQQLLIDDLNGRIYGKPQNWLPIPLALKQKQ